MSNPSPLIPQGTFQAQANRGASNVRIAVATIIAIHVVFFGGLLLQGCKRDTQLANASGTDTNSAASNLTLPPIDSGNLFYTNASHLPAESTSPAASNTLAPSSAVPPPPTDTLVSTPTNPPRDAWKPTNLGNNQSLPRQDQSPGIAKEYTVARGDNLGKIAAANGVTLAALRKANPNVEPTKLRPGMKLQIPASTASATSPTGGTAGTTDATGNAPSGDVYTVKTGDTLTKVAKSHNVSVSQLRAANSLKTSSVRVGQKLKIPAPSAGGTNKHTNASSKSTKASTNSTHSAAH